MDMAFNYLCSVMMPPTHMPNCQVVMWDLFTNLKSKGLSVEWLSLLYGCRVSRQSPNPIKACKFCSHIFFISIKYFQPLTLTQENQNTFSLKLKSSGLQLDVSNRCQKKYWAEFQLLRSSFFLKGHTERLSLIFVSFSELINFECLHYFNWTILKPFNLGYPTESFAP